ncbi:putative phospholipase B-like 2 [Mobula birostris]|uniref:putative phospholipase B-like 2 n=1 Tax=Mobula birostris TaxID=1983395 RepID=UPI003B288ABC
MSCCCCRCWQWCLWRLLRRCTALAERKVGCWSYLELGTNGTYDDRIQAYAAGVLEAEVTRPYIYVHWMNTLFHCCGSFKCQTAYCDKLKNYIETNLKWIEENLAEIPLADKDNKAYWHQKLDDSGEDAVPGSLAVCLQAPISLP